MFFSKSIWSASECPRQVAILNVPGPRGSVRLAASTWVLHSFVFFFFFFSIPFLLRYFPLVRMRLYRILILFLSLISLTVGAAAEQDLPQCAVCSL